MAKMRVERTVVLELDMNETQYLADALQALLASEAHRGLHTVVRNSLESIETTLRSAK